MPSVLRFLRCAYALVHLSISLLYVLHHAFSGAPSPSQRWPQSFSFPSAHAHGGGGGGEGEADGGGGGGDGEVDGGGDGEADGGGDGEADGAGTAPGSAQALAVSPITKVATAHSFVGGQLPVVCGVVSHV